MMTLAPKPVGPLEDTAPSLGKTSRRPPALVLEDYNQAFPTQPDASEGLVKGRQGNSVLQRLQGFLPGSFTPGSASGHNGSNETSHPTGGAAKPEPRKQKQPRSASLPSVRWDKSPLRRNTNQTKVPAKAAAAAAVESAALSGTSSSGHFNARGLKVRMLTWNMHDSLPKGELEELLGKVPAYIPNHASPPGTFPVLPDEPDHPYHFVVVAGQECPSLSGLPMALGAGFKLKEKDRDREKEREKEKDKDKGRGSLDKDSDRSATPQIRPKDGNKSPDSRNSENHSVKPKKIPIPTDDPLQTPSSEALQINIPQGPPAGWTSVIEDWLCNGGTFELPRGPKTPKIVDVVNQVVAGTVPGTPRLAIKRAPSMKEPQQGPYQFLVKERLMGIYLAIYVHRDLKPLIKGTSKSAVTAGLIGGRVGNKGGVGISVNVDGTTLLFLNTHLAAHEGRINHRLANLAKIKAELEVDDFLPKDDPRKSLEDLTDRFDFSFLCGDLNFRLDITRLHADWLISRQEYAQALAFDQLLKLMKEGAKEFKGFNEAPINFAPTFKYDVLRTLKRHKPDDDDDTASVSSLSTTYSRATDLEVNAAAQGSPSTPPGPGLTSKISLSHAVAAQKAKMRLLALKSPLLSGFAPPTKSGKKHGGKAEAEGGFPTPLTPGSPSSTVVNFYPPTPKLTSFVTATPATSLGAADVDFPSLVPPPRIKVESMKSGVGSSQENLGAERGVYDTSNKKRVPSWCDRILWKTTVEPRLPPSPIQEVQQVLMSPPPPKSTGGFRKLFRTKSAKIASRRPVPSTSNSNDDSLAHQLPPLKTAPPLSQSIFFHRSTDDRGKSGSSSYPPPSASASQSKLLQHQTLSGAMSPPPSAPADRRRSGIGVLISPLSNGESGTTAPSLWRFLPNFLSPSSYHHNHPVEEPVEEQLSPVSPAIVHRRGDVICLDYNTLDDRQMRRLEGRSDHRPVLGTFVVYI